MYILLICVGLNTANAQPQPVISILLEDSQEKDLLRLSPSQKVRTEDESLTWKRNTKLCHVMTAIRVQLVCLFIDSLADFESTTVTLTKVVLYNIQEMERFTLLLHNREARYVSVYL